MASHEIPMDGTQHEQTPVCPCKPSRRDRRGGGVTYVHQDRRPDDDDREDPDCGHLLIDVDGERQHHEIPDDGAPHAPTSECGCGPQRDTSTGHVVYLHADQNAAGELGDADEWAGGDQ